MYKGDLHAKKKKTLGFKGGRKFSFKKKEKKLFDWVGFANFKEKNWKRKTVLIAFRENLKKIDKKI